MSGFAWHNVEGQVQDVEDINRMSLHKWRDHP